MIRCGCGSSWTGLTVTHCAVCHATFSTVGNFDRHRRGGKCLTPSSVGLVLSDGGIWKTPVDAAGLAHLRSRGAS